MTVSTDFASQMLDDERSAAPVPFAEATFADGAPCGQSVKRVDPEGPVAPTGEPWFEVAMICGLLLGSIVNAVWLLAG